MLGDGGEEQPLLDSRCTPSCASSAAFSVSERPSHTLSVPEHIHTFALLWKEAVTLVTGRA